MSTGNLGSFYGNTVDDIARRAFLWTAMCGVSAAPSFIWALEGFNKAAMATGVVLFIIAYTISTSTPAFLRFRERPFVRRTLYIGYGTRLVLSILFPVGMAVDLIPGMMSISLVQFILHGVSFGGGSETNGFAATLLITIVQGTILNGLISIYMAVVWAFQAVVCKWPEERRGFPVEVTGSGSG